MKFFPKKRFLSMSIVNRLHFLPEDPFCQKNSNTLPFHIPNDAETAYNKERILKKGILSFV